MTDYLDTLTKAGEVPPPSAETLARAQAVVREAAARPARRRYLVPAAVAGAAATAVIVAGLLVGTGAEPAGPRYLADSGSASCAFSYSLETLKQRRFAFDGTVQAINRPGAGYSQVYRQHYALVTFQVNEWFKPGGGGTTAVLLSAPTGSPVGGNYAYGFPFQVGTRLLITGDQDAAFTCGFSRFYDKASAREWRKAFSK
ncbi:hypothetical protein [Kribbella sp. NPDC051718]|uniref:hypothetical protein n=1 Tax=Kribbella sp. NPDC051718 TaxID=3155168 RepID=UPI00341693DF